MIRPAKTSIADENAGRRAATESRPRSLTRLLGVFDALSQAAEGLTLSELSLSLASPKSSLLAWLRPLVADGYLTHCGGIYGLGPEIFKLSANVLSAWKFPKMLRPYIADLAEVTKETVMIGVLDRASGLLAYVEVIDSPHLVRYQAPVGATRPLYATSGGRLLLAYADEAWQQEYLQSVTFSVKTALPLTKADLIADIAMIRKQEVAISIDAFIFGLASLAAPVLNANGQCIAALIIAGPSDRFRDRIPVLEKNVREAAAKTRGVVANMSGSRLARH